MSPDGWDYSHLVPRGSPNGLVFTGFHPLEDVRMIAGDAPGQVLGRSAVLRIATPDNIRTWFRVMTGVDCLAVVTTGIVDNIHDSKRLTAQRDSYFYLYY
jgi:hypothetical protein